MMLKQLMGAGLVALGTMTLVGCDTAEKSSSAEMTLIGRYDAGLHGEEGVLEIADYHAGSKKLFATSYDKALWIIDVSDPASPKKVDKIDLAKWGKGATSVSIKDDMVAVGVVGKTKQDKGFVLVYNPDGKLLKEFTVGSLPDMVKITPDGSKILVACEGEPNDEYTVDPEGEVWVIDLANGLDKAEAKALSFKGVPMDGVRISGKNATPEQDVEPEYIAVSSDSKTAYVGLQENNAIAIVDLTKPAIVKVKGLGYKDHSLPGNELDASNKDKKINIKNWPVRGLYMPDAITSVEIGGKMYILTANEGDSREYGDEDNGPFWTDESRIGKAKLDPAKFPNAAAIQEKSELGRLKFLTTEGDTDGDGDYDELYVMGARSFTIWDEDLNVVFDSGSDFEKITAKVYPDFFNATEDENEFDDRSDDKGPEPEGIVVGEVYGKTYAFICLERIGGVMMYDISDPKNAKFVQYVNNRNFKGSYKDGTALDVSPEGLVFVDAKKSPIGKPLLFVVYEMSGSVGIYELQPKD